MDITYVKAVFGSLRKTRTQPVYRDDHDLILQLVGVKGLPVHFQAHFSNTEYGTAVVMMGSDGEVSIPNTLLATGLPVYCWILIEQGISGAVRYSVQIPVRQKARPDGTIPSEQADIISQAISALNDAGANAQEAADSAAQSAEYVAGVKDDLYDAIDRVGVLEEAKETTLEAAGNAEAWAVGNRDGSAVPSTDPAYHNNSKYYAEQAAESARTLTIDSTLTQAGQAADAKAAGDRIDGVKEDLNAAKSEIVKTNSGYATKTGQIMSIQSLASDCKITSDTSDLSVKHSGKNLLAYPYNRSSETTSHGLTCKINTDGTIRIYGEGDQAVTFALTTESPPSSRRKIKAGTYTLSGTPSNGGRGIARIFLSGVGQGSLYDDGSGKTFTLSSDSSYYIKIEVAGGQVIDLLFKPQLELSSHKTEYEPYKAETITLANGSADVTLYDGINVFSAADNFSATMLVPDIINLKSFGAVGDGITDDTVAINDALELACGRTLFVPQGTYLFSKTLNIKTNTRIIGTGEASKFLLANTYTLTPYPWRTGDVLVADQYRYPMIYMDTDTDSIIIDSIAIFGQTNAFYDKNFDGLTVRGKNHIIRNVLIKEINFFPSDFSGRTNNGVGRGINVQGANNVVVDNAVISKCGYECLGIEDASNIIVQNCHCTHALQVTGQIHRNSKQIKIIGNTFDNSDHNATGSSFSGVGFTLHASTDHPMDDIFVAYNYIKSAFVFANGGGENGVKIVNNRLAGGISLNVIDGWRNGCVVSGNTLGSQLNLKSDNAIIANNMVYHTGGGYMISASGSNVLCYGNIALNNTTRAIRVVNHDGTSATETDMTKYVS